jgi:hypothetical protein
MKDSGEETKRKMRMKSRVKMIMKVTKAALT